MAVSTQSLKATLMLPFVLLFLTVVSFIALPVFLVLNFVMPECIAKRFVHINELFKMPAIFLSSYMMMIMGAKLNMPAYEFPNSRLKNESSVQLPLPMKRSDFLLSPNVKGYLNTGTLGLIPRSSLDNAVEQWRETETDPMSMYYGPSMKMAQETQAVSAKYLNADYTEVTFVQSTTRALNSVMGGLVYSKFLAPTSTVLYSSQEHEGGTSALDFHAGRGDFVKQDVFIPLSSENTPESIVAAFEVAAAAAIEVKVIFISHVSCISGTRNPVALLAELAHRLGALIVVDGAQGAGAVQIDVKAMGVDAYTCSCQKWTLGPTGTALLYVSTEAQTKMTPVEWYHGSSMGDDDSDFLISSFYTHSVGSTSEVLIRGLASSIAYINAHGYATGRLESYNMNLRNKFYNLVAEVLKELNRRGYTDAKLYSQPPGSELAGPIVAFTIGEKLGAAVKLYSHLYSAGYICKTVSDNQCNSGSKNGIRFCFHGYNTVEDVEGSAAVIQDYLLGLAKNGLAAKGEKIDNPVIVGGAASGGAIEGGGVADNVV
jgi:selenocysteine lyase/cysteine desulfurase